MCSPVTLVLCQPCAPRHWPLRDAYPARPAHVIGTAPRSRGEGFGMGYRLLILLIGNWGFARALEPHVAPWRGLSLTRPWFAQLTLWAPKVSKTRMRAQPKIRPPWPWLLWPGNGTQGSPALKESSRTLLPPHLTVQWGLTHKPRGMAWWPAGAASPRQRQPPPCEMPSPQRPCLQLSQRAFPGQTPSLFGGSQGGPRLCT